MQAPTVVQDGSHSENGVNAEQTANNETSSTINEGTMMEASTGARKEKTLRSDDVHTEKTESKASETEDLPNAPSVGTAESAVPNGSTEPTSTAESNVMSEPPVVVLPKNAASGRESRKDLREVDLSLRVRTMYEQGTDAIVPSNITGNGSTLTEGTTVLPTIAISEPDDAEQPGALLPARPPAHSTKSFRRESMEIAGGIEDWRDMEDSEVDRYGFILPRTKSTARHGDSISLPGQGVQRVATSLRLASRPSHIRRTSRLGLHRARSMRSLGMRPLSESDGRQSALSTYSLSSQHSSVHRSVNPFRSRRQRTVDDASDMLFCVSDLADIVEDEEAGGSAVSPLRKREWLREEKWRKMARRVDRPKAAKGGGMHFAFDTTDSKVISRTWKGIPDRWRSTAWHSFLSSSAHKRKSTASDEHLTQEFHRLQDLGSVDDEQIDMDVPRTVNLHVMFRRRYRGGQRLLFRVLHAVSLYFPDVGYVQGMASLAATLLCYYDEEQAFVMMVRLWQLRGLEQLFQTGFQGLMTALDEFEKSWLGQSALARKLNELDIGPTAYGTRWYLTLFNMSVPFSSQLRVWDVFMLLGDAHPPSTGTSFGGADLDVLHATGAALIDATREIVLDSDFENAMKVLTSFVPVQDEDILMRVVKAEWKMRKKRLD